MLFYDFLSQKVSKILSLIEKKKLKLAKLNYLLLKEDLSKSLLSFSKFIKELNDKNKLSKNLCKLMIDYILIPFISDWNGLFNDVKKIYKGYSPLLQEAKIKTIIRKLGLRLEKEINFFNSFIDLITDLECYLESITTGDKRFTNKTIEQIISEVINIKKLSIQGKSELIHYISKPEQNLDDFLKQNNITKEEYETLKSRIRNLRIDQICALNELMGLVFEKRDIELIAKSIKEKGNSNLNLLITQVSSLENLKWWLELFEKFT